MAVTLTGSQTSSWWRQSVGPVSLHRAWQLDYVRCCNRRRKVKHALLVSSLLASPSQLRHFWCETCHSVVIKFKKNKNLPLIQTCLHPPLCFHTICENIKAVQSSFPFVSARPPAAAVVSAVCPTPCWDWGKACLRSRTGKWPRWLKRPRGRKHCRQEQKTHWAQRKKSEKEKTNKEKDSDCFLYLVGSKSCSKKYDISVDRMMESDVAKPLRMLSAYLMTAAMTRPPRAWRENKHRDTDGQRHDL